MAKMMKREIGGVFFEAIAFDDGRVSLAAEMTEAEYAARAEVWSLLAANGYDLDVVTHEMDADIVDAGKVWVNAASKAPVAA